MTALRYSEYRQRMDVLLCMKPLYRQAEKQRRTLRAAMLELALHQEKFERNRLRCQTAFQAPWASDTPEVSDGDAEEGDAAGDIPALKSDEPPRGALFRQF